MLAAGGWQVAYTCIPNTPHVRAVPIPTSRGTSCQRYPDIVACAGDVLALVEVEITLSESVAGDIRDRFREMAAALADSDAYSHWRGAVRRQCGVLLPETPRLACCLVTCRPIGAGKRELQAQLHDHGIESTSFQDFSPSLLVPGA